MRNTELDELRRLYLLTGNHALLKRLLVEWAAREMQDRSDPPTGEAHDATEPGAWWR